MAGEMLLTREEIDELKQTFIGEYFYHLPSLLVSRSVPFTL